MTEDYNIPGESNEPKENDDFSYYKPMEEPEETPEEKLVESDYTSFDNTPAEQMAETEFNTYDNPVEQPEETGYSSFDTPAEEPAAAEENDLATVGIVTGDRRLTVTTPIKEFEEFKTSFKNMMEAFTRLIEATGLEAGKDEQAAQINNLMLGIQQVKEDMQAEQEKLRQEMTPKDEFEQFKADTEEKAEKAAEESEDYVRRTEFDKFRQAVRDAI
ncbi:MAG: hypothetical protein JW712_07900 [Dehalococcoidales bacterium]|nr:hypothetical protein [Dehalococcoidales bacterium]